MRRIRSFLIFHNVFVSKKGSPPRRPGLSARFTEEFRQRGLALPIDRVRHWSHAGHACVPSFFLLKISAFFFLIQRTFYFFGVRKEKIGSSFFL